MDGDIVTKLGYSAYEKDVLIGLHGDFDIDDAIRYFDSEGTVIFSNEPDKYYRYQILEQIDFERLIRFRHATVKFHVQPFKYDDVERKFTIVNQLLHFNNWTSTVNGITVTATEDDTINVTGTAQTTTEFYMPIEQLKLKALDYTFTAKVKGTASGCSIRLISDRPSNYNSFGNNFVSLQNSGESEIKSHDLGTLTYNYLWFYIPRGTKLDFSMTVAMVNDEFNSFEILNRGNIKSRPKLTIYGTGDISLSLNGTAILQMKIDQDYITIDSEEMNAYHDLTLKNRQVTGDYAKLSLKTGENILSWDGNITQIEIENFSRWI